MAKPHYKIVSIEHRGPIIVKGGVQGPIPPYREEVSHLPALINLYPVYEHVDGKDPIRLDLTNYDVDHTGDAGETASNFPTPVTEATVIDEKGEVVTEEVKVEVPATAEEKAEGKAEVKQQVVNKPQTVNIGVSDKNRNNTNQTKSDALEIKM